MTPDRNEFIEGFNMGRTAGAEGRERKLRSDKEWYNAGYNNGYDVGQRKCWDIDAEGALLEVITELLSQCAAGPWQPMSTIPDGEKILVKVKLHGAFHVFVAKRHASSWEYFPEDNISYLSMYGDIVAWAALNAQEGEECQLGSK